MKIEHRNSGEDLEVKIGDSKWFKLLYPPELSRVHSQTLCQWLALQWSKFPQGRPATATLPSVLSQPASESVCFYPGSFNPWHQGHQECVRQSRERMPVVVIPDANPWKNQEHKEMSFNEAIQIARGLPPGCHLYLGFVHLNEGNPTASWLPKTNWNQRYLTMGEDSFLDLSKWRDIEVLLAALAGILIIPRQAKTQQLEEAQRKIQSLRRDFNIVMMRHHDFENISSSNFRKLETP